MPAPAQATPRAKMATRAAVVAAITLAMLASFIPMASVLAAASLTPAGNTNVSSDFAGTGNYASVSGSIVLTQAAAGDLVGTLTLDVPTGFVFRAGFGTATIGGTDCGSLAAGATTVSTTQLSVTVTGTGGTTAACTLTVSGLQVQPTAGTPLASGNITASGMATGNAGHLTEILGAAVLTFTQGAFAPVTAMDPLSPQPAVHDQDSHGNARAGDSVTLSIASGPTGATLSCTNNTVVTDASGNAVFAGCKLDLVGSYTLRAAVGASTATSTTIQVNGGSPTQLKFGQYPSNPSSTSLGNVTVIVADAGGNPVDVAVSVSLASSPAGAFSCTSGLTVTSVHGTATFTGCTQSTIANGYALVATSAPLPSKTGVVFNVTSGPATKLAFCWGSVASSCSTTPPTSPVGGGIWTPQPTVIVQDASGNRVTSLNTGTVSIGITSGTPTSGGPGTLTCSGGTTIGIVAGVATFSGCTIDKAGTGYKLTATSGTGYTSATSTAFSVVAGTPTKLVFTAQPTSGAAGQAFATQPIVAITDAGGNVSSTTSATITLSLTSNPGGGTLTCTGGLSKTTTLGVATFSGCAISAAGSGYVITATASNVSPVTTLTSASTNAFNLTAQQAELTLTTTSNVITWGAGVTLTAHFLVSGANRAFALQASTDSFTWTSIANLTTDSSGYASLFYRPARNLWYRASWAGSGDLTAATSPTVRVVVRQIAILRPTNGGAVKTVAVGTTTAFTTTVRPARPELPKAKVEFRVYKKTGGSWVVVKTAFVFIDSSGISRFSYKFASRGEYYVRSYTWPTTANANSVWSQLERYSVR